jgi:hypothetical protein
LPDVLLVLCSEAFLLLALYRLQDEVISKNGLSLAFCVVAMFPVARGSLCKAPFKCADEAGGMLISNVVGDFFHAHVAARQKARSSLKPLFVQPFAHANAGLVLKQALEVRRAQVEFEGQVADGEGRPRLSHPKDPLHAPFRRIDCQLAGHASRSLWLFSIGIGAVYIIRSCKPDT